MKQKSILFISFLLFSLAAKSQERKHPKYAEITEPITPERLADYRAELLTYLESLPSWKNQGNLNEKVTFDINDIQIYGWYNFPTLQIDFRYTFESKRKKGFMYQAQYIYVSQPTLNKYEVIIDSGTTTYFKFNPHLNKFI